MKKKTDGISFKRFLRRAHFLNPLRDYQEDSRIIEHRHDPLTGALSIFPGEAKRLLGNTNLELIRKVVEDSRENCFLCPDKVMTMTPKYPPDFLPMGRITIGESVLFPNLNPLSEFHAVVSLSRSHHLELKSFSSKLLADGFKVALEFVRNTITARKSVKYMTIACNYLFPAGASATHPHLQVLGGDIPYNYLSNVLEKSQEYYELNSSNYWEDLVREEKKLNVRYLGKIDETEWLTSFSPTGCNEALVSSSINTTFWK